MLKRIIFGSVKIVLHPSALLIGAGLAIMFTTGVMSDAAQVFTPIADGFEAITHALR